MDSHTTSIYHFFIYLVTFVQYFSTFSRPQYTLFCVLQRMHDFYFRINRFLSKIAAVRINVAGTLGNSKISFLSALSAHYTD